MKINKDALMMTNKIFLNKLLQIFTMCVEPAFLMMLPNFYCHDVNFFCKVFVKKLRMSNDNFLSKKILKISSPPPKPLKQF
jgi:hypothetical protein